MRILSSRKPLSGEEKHRARLGLFRSLTHQGMVFPRIELESIRRRSVAPRTLFSDEVRPVLEDLISPASTLVRLVGPRGTGKSLALSVGASQLNYQHARQRGKVAIQLSCSAISESVADGGHALGYESSEIPTLVLLAIILEFYCNLRRISLIHEKIADVAEQSFPWVFGRATKGITLLHDVIRKIEEFFANLADGERAKAEADLSQIYRHGAPFILDLIRNNSLPRHEWHERLRGEYRAMCAGFVATLEQAGVKELFIFLDDFSEADVVTQSEIQTACSTLYNDTQRKELQVYFRAALYFGDNFDLTSRSNVVPGPTLWTVPFRKFARPIQQMMNGSLDDDLAAHISQVLTKRATLFSLGGIADCFDVASSGDFQDVLKFLATASGGSIRLIGGVLSEMVQARLGDGKSEYTRLSLDTIRDYSVRYFSASSGGLLRYGMQAHLRGTTTTEAYDRTWAWLKNECIKSGKGEVTCLLRKRFMVGNEETVLQLKPFLNSGLIYVWSELALGRRPAAVSPTYVLAISEGIRLSCIGISDEALPTFAGVGSSEMEASFERLRVFLDQFLK